MIKDPATGQAIKDQRLPRTRQWKITRFELMSQSSPKIISNNGRRSKESSLYSTIQKHSALRWAHWIIQWISHSLLSKTILLWILRSSQRFTVSAVRLRGLRLAPKAPEEWISHLLGRIRGVLTQIALFWTLQMVALWAQSLPLDRRLPRTTTWSRLEPQSRKLYSADKQ